MVLLDWEKAFDKVTREGLMSALGRMNVHPKLQEVIGAMYKQPTFRVEMDGCASKWHKQETGIRQGCPLSPYLFLIIMTVMFKDIHEGDPHNLIKHRLMGTNYDEVLYADDTICISTDTRAMNKLLASIEKEGARYGLKLNRNKCEVILTGGNADIHFSDGTRVTQKDEVKYLGCQINNTSDVNKELNGRIAACMATLKGLHAFWRHSDCPIRFKLQAFDAVIRSKLLYGLESAQLNEPHQRRLNTFQLKGLRKILHMQTTFVNRENTNERVITYANSHLTGAGIKLLSEIYEQNKTKLFAK
jgi:hypothetical protein